MIHMRSLTLKLTLAFLGVGLLGITIVAVLVRQRTQFEFDRFVLERTRSVLAEELADYYAARGSWEGLDIAFRRLTRLPSRQGLRSLPLIITDAEGHIVFAQRPRHLPPPSLSPEEATPIRVDGETVGWLYLDLPSRSGLSTPETPEWFFLQRLGRLILLSAIGAGLISVLIGVGLARWLTRPIRDLTAAMQRVARGELGVQVDVGSDDELGELAAAFNKMSRDLERADHLRRQMTADIAHELRTPVSVLLGYTEALHDGKLAGDPEVYDVLYRETQHLSRLIEDLRILSLADAGELPLTRQPVHPRDLVHHVLRAYAQQAAEKDITLTADVAEDVPFIHVDPDRMAQVLNNLVSNAVRYTPPGGNVTLSVTRNSHAVVFQVQDTGPGIPPEEVPFVFNRFYRGDKARSGENGASGLGLAIAKSIVEAHGGTITVSSRQGAGTTFTVTLPVSGK